MADVETLVRSPLALALALARPSAERDSLRSVLRPEFEPEERPPADAVEESLPPDLPEPLEVSDPPEGEDELLRLDELDPPELEDELLLSDAVDPLDAVDESRLDVAESPSRLALELPSFDPLVLDDRLDELLLPPPRSLSRLALSRLSSLLLLDEVEALEGEADGAERSEAAPVALSVPLDAAASEGRSSLSRPKPRNRWESVLSTEAADPGWPSVQPGRNHMAQRSMGMADLDLTWVPSDAERPASRLRTVDGDDEDHARADAAAPDGRGTFGAVDPDDVAFARA